MPNIEIKHLYNYSRFPNIIPLLLYLPIGIVLVLLRLILFLPVLIFSTILPSNQWRNGILLKLLCYTFGISINVENLDKKEDVEAYISNQISIFDHFVIHALTGSIKPGFRMDTQLSPIFGVKYFGSSASNDSFKNNVAHFVTDSKTPLFFQPESVITNGKALLKFNTWPFTLCSKVQPIVLNVKRPLVDISISTINSSFWVDALFFMFSPFTVYNIQFLPAAERKGMSETDFARKIQNDMAKVLKIEAVEHTSSDLKEWTKRYNLEQRMAHVIQPQRPPPNTINSELQRMSLQVKEVLPMVPLKDIMRDLSKTRNVDVTITNILEGSVPYIPEQIAPTASTSSCSSSTPAPTVSSFTPSSAAQSGSKDPFNTAAQSFGKSATERSMSFQERKRLLIENARQRYIEKHDMPMIQNISRLMENEDIFKAIELNNCGNEHMVSSY